MYSYVVMARCGERWFPVANATSMRDALNALEYTIPLRWEKVMQRAFHAGLEDIDGFEIVEFFEGYAMTVHRWPDENLYSID